MASEDTTARLPRAVSDLEERLSALEAKFADRKYDTRPMFEAHEQRIKYLESQLAKLRTAPESVPLAFERGMYWIEGDAYPFCPNCYEGTKHERRHLQPAGNPGQHWCTSCKHHYKDPAVPEVQVDEPFGLRVGSDDDDDRW